MAKQADVSGLSVKIDVDVAEAIRGLKAVQREAKKATQELREYAAAYPVYYASGLREYSSEDLREELRQREESAGCQDV